MKVVAALAMLGAASAQSDDAYDSVSFIDFEYFEDTYECDAINQFDFDYPSVWAFDSHNEEIDVCGRIYQNQDGALTQCCQPDDRAAEIDGCENFWASYPDLSEDSFPYLCQNDPESDPCGSGEGILTTEVNDWYVTYDACDYSYNCAEQIMYDIKYEDTTPPEITAAGCKNGEWEETVEKCTYFEEPEPDSMDTCDVSICTPGISITYGGAVTSGATEDEYGAQVGRESEQYCTGGESVEYIDEEITGTYCLEYNDYDASGNEAFRETFVVYVEDTIPCEIYFEETHNTHECCEDTDIIDYGEYSTNLPCTDEPLITMSYEFDACHTTSEEQEVSYWADDGEGNDCTGCTYFEIQDTTPPSCTAPADEEHCVSQDDGAYECWDGEDWSEEGCDAEYSDSCDDGVSISDDHLETVDEDTIGTYTVTYTTTDNAGNSATCSTDHSFEDCTACLCDPNTCSASVEACTGEYEEMGAYFYDTYDTEIQSKSTTTVTSPDGNSVCEYGEGSSSGNTACPLDNTDVGTWTITYYSVDQSGWDCSCGIDVEVSDNTPPTVSVYGDDVEILEASSDYSYGWASEPANLGGTCEDTCEVDGTASFSLEVFDYGYGVDVFDITDAIDEMTSGYTDGAGDSNTWIQDEQQYYCGMDIDYAQAAADSATEAQDLYELAADCAFYSVTFTCTDWQDNTATATQYIATIDTTPPTTYWSDCYDDSSEEDCTIFGMAYAVAVKSAVPAAGVALVAVVAAVAFKTGRRSAYSKL